MKQSERIDRLEQRLESWIKHIEQLHTLIEVQDLTKDSIWQDSPTDPEVWLDSHGSMFFKTLFMDELRSVHIHEDSRKQLIKALKKIQE